MEPEWRTKPVLPVGGMNARRAYWAESAVVAYASAADCFGEPLDVVLGDLLVNLRHFCDREGLDFDALVDFGLKVHDHDERNGRER
jgi:hypothetical protein